MGMLVDNKFSHGDVVYLKTDKDQNPRIVYCFRVYQNEVLYDVACGTSMSTHYEFELSTEINVLLNTTN